MGKFGAPAPRKTRIRNAPALGSSSSSLVFMYNSFIIFFVCVSKMIDFTLRNFVKGPLKGAKFRQDAVSVKFNSYPFRKGELQTNQNSNIGVDNFRYH